jgi:hypothetical protein
VKLMEAVDTTSRCRSARSTRVPDADRGHLLDLGARHGGDGSRRAGVVKVGETVEIVGIRRRRRRS